jgi:hypothetical protein
MTSTLPSGTALAIASASAGGVSSSSSPTSTSAGALSAPSVPKESGRAAMARCAQATALGGADCTSPLTRPKTMALRCLVVGPIRPGSTSLTSTSRSSASTA